MFLLGFMWYQNDNFSVPGCDVCLISDFQLVLCKWSTVFLRPDVDVLMISRDGKMVKFLQKTKSVKTLKMEYVVVLWMMKIMLS